MRDDLTHLIALTIDRSDWIISEIFRGKRPYSPVPFLNGELLLLAKNLGISCVLILKRALYLLNFVKVMINW